MQRWTTVFVAKSASALFFFFFKVKELQQSPGYIMVKQQTRLFSLERLFQINLLN